ncbi:PAS domain S-box protein [Phormidium pseudopriestleyi FRX01]|uniref:histidine kinase n=1 Tax=Phormidium pseudopriestleyi FRX01 TaxID=1759528 RepID=A0ABS3FSU0_9CYAN|nr:PAS domain S-box protein [Phormidium pseudopriestleyi]MBO0350185.1 PAS domain S-box protein [Phormidium pseudopriestleyi FRX01]
MLNYVAATASVAIALLLTQLLSPLIELTPSLLFFAAVAVSAGYGGIGPGLFATVLCAATIDHFFKTSTFTWSMGWGDLIWVAVLSSITVLISSLKESKQQAVQELQKKQLFLQVMTDSLPVAISYVDALELYRFNNQRYEEWFGHSRDFLSGKHLKEILGEAAYQVIRPYVKVALSGESVTYETNIPYEGGGSRYIRATYVPDWGQRQEVKGFIAFIEDITQQRQAEDRLRESQQRSKLALDAAQMGTWEWNLKTGKVKRSAMVARIFGSEQGSFDGTYEAFVEGIYPEDRPSFEQAVQRAIANQQDYEIEFRVPRGNLGIRWVLCKGQVAVDEDGQPWRALGVCMNVTESRYASVALQVSEERFRHIYESNLIGLVFGDRNGNISEANNAFLNIVGYTLDDLRSRRVIWQNINPLDYSDDEDMTVSLGPGVATPTETELIRKDGGRVPVLMGQVPLQDYTNMGISFVLDLSERKQAQAALSESEERLRLALEAAQMGMWDWDIATGKIAQSEIVDRLLGLESGSNGWTYNSLIKIVHPDDRPAFNAVAIATMERGQDFNVEFRVVKPDGTVAWVASIGKRLPDKAKNGDRLIGVCMDITERKQIEIELYRREQEFKALAENAPDIIARMDARGRYQYVNQAIEQVTGISQTAFIGKTLGELGFPEEIDALWKEGVREVLATAQEGIVEGYLPTPKGTRYYQSRLVPEQALDGSLDHAICISRDITDLKQTQEALRETNQTLKALIQACPLAVMVLDATGQVKMWNRSAERILGWSEAEAIGRQFPAISAEKRQELQENIGATLAGNPLMGLETRRLTKVGTQIDVAIWTAPLRDAKGNVSYLSILADISDRKQAEEALRDSEERFRTLVNSMDDIVFTLDHQGRHTAIFGRWFDRTGITPEHFIDKTAGDIFGPQAASIHNNANQMALAGESVIYEWSFQTDAGTQYCQTSLSPLFDRLGGVTGIVGVGRDITERRQAELRQYFLAEVSSVLASSLDYPTTLTSLANLVVPTIADYCVIYIVEDAGQISGLAMAHTDRTKEALLRQMEQHYPLDLNHEDGIVQVVSSGKPILIPALTEEMRVAAARDPEHLRLMRELGCQSCTIVPLVARGRILGAISFAIAESGRRYQGEDLMLAEELARRAGFAIDNARLYRESQEANQMKDEFLAVVSHELRTPLNAMLGWAQLLRTRKFDEVTTERALETIERNARVQTQLIEDLLDVSRILRGQVALSLQPVDLSVAIALAIESLRPSAEAKQIELIQNVKKSVGVVSGDINRIQQVVWNLLSNAIKFTPSEGRVEVRLKRSHNLAILEVVDTGMGIAPDFLPFVFERFRQADSTTTRSYGGLGLGLAIVRHLLEMHGGSIRAYSEGTGKGATFTVTLPLLQSIQGNELVQDVSELILDDSDPVDDESPLTGLRVLVVEDEADTLEFLIATLEMAGAMVVGVSSATQALAAIAEQKPDVLVSDIGMPELDGYSLIRQVRSQESDSERLLPALALTAYARDSDRDRALNAGFHQHISKPIQPDRLITVVKILAVQG